MSTTSQTADLRPALRTAYLLAFDSFATDAGEVATATGTDSKQANALLRKLDRAGLCVGDHVNGEKNLTWQCLETYDSISRSTALRRFDKAFPKGETVAPAADAPERNGATGPRYTEEQLAQAEALRSAGETFKAIGVALEIKATAYLSKKLKERAAAREAAEKATPKKVRRSTKKAQA